MNSKFSPWPSFTQEEIDSVRNVLSSNNVNYWTGDECRAFEKEFASWSDSKHAVALANGTLALDIAFKALSIGVGDEVIVTSRTFIASISSIINSGAKPVFVDIDIASQNITPQNINSAITAKTKAILCVHLAGWPCSMDEIMTIANHHDLFVIEDCAQAHGAKYKGKPVGSIGHIGCWSFCQDKIITTGGEGGMVTTNNVELAEKLRLFRSHGMVRDVDPHTWLYNAETLGYNYRLTDIQAALGLSQLHRLDSFISQRNEIAERYRELLSDLPITLPPAAPAGALHGYHLFAIHVAERARVFRELRQAGIGVQVHYVPVHHHGISTDIELPPGGLPKCEQVYEGLISIPIHPGLSRGDQDTVVREIRKTVVK